MGHSWREVPILILPFLIKQIEQNRNANDDQLKLKKK